MNRGVERREIFVHSGHGVRFLELLGEHGRELSVSVHAYALMPNHYHLLLSDPGGELSTFMQRVMSEYVHAFNPSVDRDGPLCRARFTSIPIEDECYLTNVFRYVHRNPLEKAVSDDLALYRWTSYPSYMSDADPPPWLRTDFFREVVGGPDRIEQLVCGAPRQPGSLPEVLWSIHMALDTAGVPADALPGRIRTLLVALVDDLPASIKADAEAQLGYSNPKNQRRAIRRALAQIELHAGLRSAWQEVRAVLKLHRDVA